MKYTWFMFLVLTVAGGLIAFMGDRLGRYMGKRRMTVFGLRPRHTALCFTVVAGMLIALTSLGVMSSISKDVRVALFAVDDLTRQRMTLPASGDLTRQNRSLSQETSGCGQTTRSRSGGWRRFRGRTAVAAAGEHAPAAGTL